MKDFKIICNKFIPFSGFSEIMLFGKIFRREEYCNKNIYKSTINHEGIHFEQALDFVGGIDRLSGFGFICFYVGYFIEGLIKAILSLLFKNIKPYYSISFECEAYDNQYKYDYQKSRKRFAGLKFIFKFKKNRTHYL